MAFSFASLCLQLDQLISLEMSGVTETTQPGEVKEKDIFDNSKYAASREKISISYLESFEHWFKSTFNFKYSPAKAEEKILSYLPFFPQEDDKRKAQIINTPIANGNYIHEFCIENKQESIPSADGKKEPLHIVLVHGYAASLVLFLNNFNVLSLIPGVRIHAIDMLGFGLSSRPKFPNLPYETVKDVQNIESFFTDAIEEWRIKRNINKFVLVGHSLGAYLASSYAMKYNKIQSSTGESLLSKILLISPAGVERNKYSLLKNKPSSFAVSDQERLRENNSTPNIDMSQEVTVDQEDIIHGVEERKLKLDESNLPNTNVKKVIMYTWKHHISPMSFIRATGPFKSKIISGWTRRRFAEYYDENPKKFEDVHRYIYELFSAKGSGEYCLTKLFMPFMMAQLPLLDRCPQTFTAQKLPNLWVYGDTDWMDSEAGEELVKESNVLSQKEYNFDLSTFKVVSNAGHNVQLDNPEGFHKVFFDFLGYEVPKE